MNGTAQEAVSPDDEKAAFGERYRQSRDRRGLEDKDIVQLCRAPKATVSRWSNGLSVPDARWVFPLAEALRVDPRWLSTGEQQQLYSSAADVRQPVSAVPPTELVELAEIDVAYGMGGTFIDEAIIGRSIAFSASWIRQLTDSPPEHLFVAKGIGDSMLPTIQAGDFVLVDRTQNTPRMIDQIWAVALGDIGAIKRLRPLPNGSVRMLSDNPAVPPEDTYDNELHVIGRVVAIVRKM